MTDWQAFSSCKISSFKSGSRLYWYPIVFSPLSQSLKKASNCRLLQYTLAHEKYPNDPNKTWHEVAKKFRAGRYQGENRGFRKMPERPSNAGEGAWRRFRFHDGPGARNWNNKLHKIGPARSRIDAGYRKKGFVVFSLIRRQPTIQRKANKLMNVRYREDRELAIRLPAFLVAGILFAGGKYGMDQAAAARDAADLWDTVRDETGTRSAAPPQTRLWRARR